MKPSSPRQEARAGGRPPDNRRHNRAFSTAQGHRIVAHCRVAIARRVGRRRLVTRQTRPCKTGFGRRSPMIDAPWRQISGTLVGKLRFEGESMEVLRLNTHLKSVSAE